VQTATSLRTVAQGQSPAISHADGVQAPSSGYARRLAVGTETIRQELCQQRLEDGICGWPCGLRESQHCGKTQDGEVDISSYRLIYRPTAGVGVA